VRFRLQVQPKQWVQQPCSPLAEKGKGQGLELALEPAAAE
jgi:hypothetical protein